jgi:acyl carrier protein
VTDRDAVFERIVPIILEQIPVRLRGVSITPDMDLTKDLGINSAAMVDIVMTLEEVFRLKPVDTYAFETVADLVDLVLQQPNR